jgi:hypothetical protein
MQIGQMPSRSVRAKTAPLTAEFWTLDSFRSVQYVQTITQRQALDAALARRRAAAADTDNQPAV